MVRVKVKQRKLRKEPVAPGAKRKPNLRQTVKTQKQNLKLKKHLNKLLISDNTDLAVPAMRAAFFCMEAPAKMSMPDYFLPASENLWNRMLTKSSLPYSHTPILSHLYSFSLQNISKYGYSYASSCNTCSGRWNFSPWSGFRQKRYDVRRILFYCRKDRIPESIYRSQLLWPGADNE